MKRLSLIVIFLTSISLFGMERQQTPDAALLGQACLKNLPAELKTNIIIFLSSSSLYESISDICNLSKANKQFYRSLNDAKVIDILINLLSNKITIHWNETQIQRKIRVASQLRVPVAFFWVKKQLPNAEIEQAINNVLSVQVLTFSSNRYPAEILAQINFLLSLGVNANSISYNRPLLFHAVGTNNIPLIQLLLTFDANINLVTYNTTVLDHVLQLRRFNNGNLINFLRLWGAKTAAELNQQGQS